VLALDIAHNDITVQQLNELHKTIALANVEGNNLLSLRPYLTPDGLATRIRDAFVQNDPDFSSLRNASLSNTENYHRHKKSLDYIIGDPSYPPHLHLLITIDAKSAITGFKVDAVVLDQWIPFQQIGS
jgi:hypothetical protein